MSLVPVGNNTVGGVDDTMSVDTIAGFRVVTTTTGKVKEAVVHCSGLGAGVGNQKFRVFVYREGGGSLPGALLGVSDEVTITDGAAYGWVNVPFSQSVYLPGGNIWLAFNAPNPTDGNQIKAFAGSGIRFKAGVSYAAAPPDPWPSGDAASGTKIGYSIYLNVETGGAMVRIRRLLRIGKGR